MADIIIQKVSKKSDMERFVRFNAELYKGCPWAVPDFLEDTLNTFSTEKNAAFEFCRAEWFLALKDDKIVGRVVAFINDRANEKWHRHSVRFGWIDFIDDEDVSRALLDTVAQWGRERGMTEMHGPLGFTDMDPEGMLVDGFETMSTMSTIYNYPYYPTHFEHYGMEKETDWLQRCVAVPHKGDPGWARYSKVADMVSKRYGLKVHKFKSKKEIMAGGYDIKFFETINKSYAPLFGYSTMTDKQMKSYAEQYLKFLDPRLLSIVENDKDEVVAVAACMPSLSKALQKADGKLLPWGWWHLLKALYWKHDDILDLLLIGVVPEYQDKGAVTLIFADLLPTIDEMGFKWAEVHPQLEDNTRGLGIWDVFNSTIHKRRRAWKKTL